MALGMDRFRIIGYPMLRLERLFYVATMKKLTSWLNPLSPPSDPVQRRLQGPPAKSKFLAVGLLSKEGWRLQSPPAKSNFLAVSWA
jgi:hypothetical protein